MINNRLNRISNYIRMDEINPNYICFQLDTKLEVFALSNGLKRILSSKNIVTIDDLIKEKIEIEEGFLYEYNKLYNYFHNIIYNRLKISYSKQVINSFYRIPFGIGKFIKGNTYKTKEIISFAKTNYKNLDKDEQINLRFYLYWLSYFNEEIDKTEEVSNIYNDTININFNNLYLFNNTYVINLNISSGLKKIFVLNSILTIDDLIIKKINVDKKYIDEYEKIFSFVTGIIQKTFNINFSDDMKNLFIRIPFDVEMYKKGNYYKISELLTLIGTRFNELSLIEKINIKLLLYWLTTINYEYIKGKFIKDLNINDREINILSKRSYTTLSEIGNKYGITRERIRQVEARANKKCKKIFLEYPFRLLDLNKIYYVDECSEFELLQLYFLTNYENKYELIKNEDRLYFLPLCYENSIKEILEKNDEAFEYFGYIKVNNIPNLDVFIKSVKHLKLNYNNGYISKKSHKRLYVKYAMRYIGRPVSISSDKDQEEIIRIVKKIFGEELIKGRAIVALINSVGLRVDSGLYVADDLIKPLSANMIDNIVEYVKERKIINTRDLFIKFEKELLASNLKNEVILYRYLKDNISDRLYFHGVSAVISSDPNLTCWGDVAIKEIKESGKPINKIDFKLKHSLTDAVYNMLPVNFNDIIIWSNKELYLKSMINISYDLVQELKEYIKEKEYVKFNELVKIIKNYDSSLLEKNNVNSNVNLYYFFKNIFEKEFIINKDTEDIYSINKKEKVLEDEYLETEELTI